MHWIYEEDVRQLPIRTICPSSSNSMSPKALQLRHTQDAAKHLTCFSGSLEERQYDDESLMSMLHAVAITIALLA